VEGRDLVRDCICDDSSCDKRSESPKGLGLGVRIIAAVGGGGEVVQKYKCVQFSEPCDGRSESQKGLDYDNCYVGWGAGASCTEVRARVVLRAYGEVS